jgi:hypothetical protein
MYNHRRRSQNHLAQVVARRPLALLELEQQRVVEVLVVGGVVLLLVHVALPHRHVIVVHDHALEVQLGHVHELVERVRAVGREDEAGAVHLEQA